MNIVARYLLNIALSLDRLGNAICGGASVETISSRLGRIKEEHGGKIPWTRPIAKVIDAGLNIIQKDHSEHAIERNVFNKIKSESIIDSEIDMPKCYMLCTYSGTEKCKICKFNIK